MGRKGQARRKPLVFRLVDHPALNKPLKVVVQYTPQSTQDWLQRLKWKIKLRLGCQPVPLDAITRKYRDALQWLVAHERDEKIGDYLEFGVFSGTSMACMYRASRDMGLHDMRLFGFDSFQGFPPNAADEDDGYWTPGYWQMDEKYTRKYLTRQRVDWSKVFLVKGWFCDTLTSELREQYQMQKASVIMIDCDLYSSAKEALEFCEPLIQERAVIFFDDWNAGNLAEKNMGEKRAFKEFLGKYAAFRAEEIGSYNNNSKVFCLLRIGRPQLEVGDRRLAEIEELVSLVEGVHAGRVAAFLDFDSRTQVEQTIVLAESEHHDNEAEATRIILNAREHILTRFHLSRFEVELVAPEWLEKGFSGAIAREANKKKWAEQRQAGWWIQHAHEYVELIIGRFRYDGTNTAIEVASYDGSLLPHLAEKGVRVLGIEPAAFNLADAPRGVPVIGKFFNSRTAEELVTQGTRADLLIGVNVLGHQPDVPDFVSGLKLLLKPDGIVTLEFPYPFERILQCQFDEIYREHFAYFSLQSVNEILHQHGLTVVDALRLPGNGGVMRVFACHDAEKPSINERVGALLDAEMAAKTKFGEAYRSFWSRVKETRTQVREFLRDVQEQGQTVAGYGIPSRSNTLLGYCGVKCKEVAFTVDSRRHGRVLPGSHIPVFHPELVRETKPNYLMILPRQPKDQIMAEMAFIREWDGKFVVLAPEVQVYC